VSGALAAVVIITALGACASSRGAGAPAPEAVPDSVVVTPAGARLVVALGSEATVWRWYDARTPTSVMEYEWNVIVPDAAGDYHLGYRLFKFPGAAPESGDLNALVRRGQVDVGRASVEDGRTVVLPARLPLGLRPEPRRLVFLLRDSAAVATVFRERPATATVTRRLGNRALPPRVVPIVYRTSGTPDT
jgi:hypothetical protein